MVDPDFMATCFHFTEDIMDSPAVSQPGKRSHNLQENTREMGKSWGEPEETGDFSLSFLTFTERTGTSRSFMEKLTLNCHFQ